MVVNSNKPGVITGKGTGWAREKKEILAQNKVCEMAEEIQALLEKLILACRAMWLR